MIITDFRIGNFVQEVESKELLRVCALTSDDGTIYCKSNICAFVIDRSKYPLPDGWKFEPIPLTEEWLLKLGFRQILQSNIYQIQDGSLTFEYCFSDPNKVILRKMKWEFDLTVKKGFVHELQNLFHTLTGNELTVKQ